MGNEKDLADLLAKHFNLPLDNILPKYHREDKPFFFQAFSGQELFYLGYCRFLKPNYEGRCLEIIPKKYDICNYCKIYQNIMYGDD